jgi:hypothetical protein
MVRTLQEQVRTLRTLMAQVYALFDRRCRTQTALAKLATLWRRLLRFTQVGETLKKLLSPTLEKALTFLDDKLLPSTSHAVERGNRRDRKRQKQVYRVRTQAQSSARLALDMWREAKGQGVTKPSTPYMRHGLPEATRYPYYSLQKRYVIWPSPPGAH